MSTTHLSEQELLRREKLAEMIMMGIDPYPAALFPVNTTSTDIKENYKEENKEQFADLCIAGRYHERSGYGQS
jgi:lysyl-tRNA synthetase class 2